MEAVMPMNGFMELAENDLTVINGGRTFWGCVEAGAAIVGGTASIGGKFK